MRYFLQIILFFLITSCDLGRESIANPKLSSYKFLNQMSQDEYFPGHLVAKGTDILVDLCIEIESKKPNTLEEIYALTHQATERFNLLAYELEEQGSELETVARENIGMDIEFILQSYGYEIDIEEAIAPREW